MSAEYAALTRTRQALAYAERHWHMLAELHTATPGPSGNAGRRIDPPTPARLDVIDTADQLAAEVAEWHNQIPRPMTAIDAAAHRPQARIRALTRNLGHMHDLDGFPAWAAQTRDTIAAHIGDKAPGRTWTCLCGTPMRVRAWLPTDKLTDTGPTTTCRGCGTAWDRATILDAADPEGACTCLPPWAPCQPVDAWADPATLEAATGVPQRTLRQWGRTGRVRREAGRYHIGDTVTAQRQRTLDKSVAARHG